MPLRRTLCDTSAVVRTAAVEAAALAGHLLLYPSGLGPEPWPEWPPPPGCGHAATGRPHGPVLLLHGLFDNRAVFLPLRRSLRAHGHRHVHAVNHGPLAGDVHDAAVRFATLVVRARDAYGGERVGVVGHSLGGLIARYYVQRLGGDEHVHTVVTLGTPHQGTRSALLLPVLPSARQLLPGSPVLAALDSPAPGCGTRFLVFWGDRDPLVLPSGNGRLHHPDLLVENVRVPGAGHLELTVHPGVLARAGRALAEAVEADRPGAPGPDTLLSA
ncbi:alpha/beta fold hydrolase [Streptacidiphilus sp. PB12-B1b]|nr:alpha/beta fold hydrolase [Streptacidiphilus sp. PB12-B1b]